MKNEDEFKRLYPITSNEVLAKKYEYSESFIRTLAARLGVTKLAGSHNGSWTKKQEVFILKHYKKDLTGLEISEKLGKTKSAIINKYRELSGLRDKKVITKISKNG